jgi:hypothetical protein
MHGEYNVKYSSRKLHLHQHTLLIMTVWFNMAAIYVACIDEINCACPYVLDCLCVSVFVFVLSDVAVRTVVQQAVCMGHPRNHQHLGSVLITVEWVYRFTVF